MSARKRSKKLRTRIMRSIIALGVIGLFGASGLLIWAATLPLPTLDDFNERVVKQTTKIYDNTGEHLLYDVYKNIQRTVVPLDKIAPHMRNATIAVEDDNFYNHHGVEPTAIIRATWENIQALGFEQGGSTLTQQVVKNSLLTPRKTISRKLKEWILAVKLDASKTKDDILEIYLNEVPYGGSLYGAEAAAQAYFKKSADELTIAESAYLAALPKAPTYYSPYGSHRNALENRQREVLSAMHTHGFISNQEYNDAKQENVEFQPRANVGIQAPHFVMYVREQIAEKYDADILEHGGLKVVTTLDIEVQKKAQEVVHKHATQNEERFNAENAGMVVIDSETGHILAMVGSRDYFDTDIDGNFNITTAHRQPGSAFKPFAYAQAFQTGYTPETILFDLRTQFSTACQPADFSRANPCYSPVNYDGVFRGPVRMRHALAQSINIPAIKTLYLAGLDETFNLTRDMGLTGLTNPDQYGLTLVLGGGEVTLLNLVSSYSVFSNEGSRNPHTPIKKIFSPHGDTLDKFKSNEQRVLDVQTSRQITDVLSDNEARTPAFGANSPLYFPGHDIAAKTGTTNDYRDAWIIGYTSNTAVGAWAGNNDNTPMSKQVAGFIVAPMWREFMVWFLNYRDSEPFTAPKKEHNDLDLKPVLRGQWIGGVSHKIDSTTGARATKHTPEEALKEVRTGGIHSILHWVDKENPRGSIPDNPASDPQYANWEYPVRQWVQTYNFQTPTEDDIPDDVDDVHNPENEPDISFIKPDTGDTHPVDERITLEINNTNEVFPLKNVTYYLNTAQLAVVERDPFVFEFTPQSLDIELREENIITAVARDEVLNTGRATTTLRINESQ